MLEYLVADDISDVTLRIDDVDGTVHESNGDTVVRALNMVSFYPGVWSRLFQ